MTTNDQPLCAASIRRQTLTDPPEYCDDDAIEGSEYCENHGGADDAPDDRDTYKERIEDSMNYWLTEHSDRL